MNKKLFVLIFVFVLFFSASLAQAELDGKEVLVVIPHQDDEPIFFLPLLEKADVILMAAYPASDEYWRIIKQMPYNLRDKWVPLQGMAPHDWAKEVAHNIALRKKIVTDEFLKEKLRPFIQATDMVFTSNPWGDYGNLQHQQIFRVVEELVKEYKKDLYCWNGAINVHTFAIRTHYLSGPTSSIRMYPDIEKYEEIMNLYLEAEEKMVLQDSDTSWNNVLWTWSTDYRPPKSLVFYRMVEKGRPAYNSSEVETIKKSVLWELEYGGERIKASSRMEAIIKDALGDIKDE